MGFSVRVLLLSGYESLKIGLFVVVVNLLLLLLLICN